jgi:hypothetical protein
VTLHDTGEALALGRARRVDALAGLEGLGRDLLAELVVGGVGRAELDEVTARRDAGLLEVAAHRLVHLAGVDRTEGDLDRGVAVGLVGTHLRHDAGAGLDHGHGDELVVCVPHLGHAELLAEHALDVLLSNSHLNNRLRA